MKINSTFNQGFQAIKNTCEAHPKAFMATIMVTSVALAAIGAVSMTFGALPGLCVGIALIGTSVLLAATGAMVHRYMTTKSPLAPATPVPAPVPAAIPAPAPAPVPVPVPAPVAAAAPAPVAAAAPAPALALTPAPTPTLSNKRTEEEKLQDSIIYKNALLVNFTPEEAGGGGDCLFHSLFFHLHTVIAELKDLSAEQGHLKMRAMAVEVMKNNKDEFMWFIDRKENPSQSDAFDKYVTNMAQPTVWGGDPEISAIFRYLQENGYNVQLVAHDCKESHTTYYPQDVPDDAQRLHFIREGCHWRPLIEK